MLGELTPEQINAVLFSEVVGRVGCYSEGRTTLCRSLTSSTATRSMHTAL
jgi:hypothetical protein